MLVGYFQTYDIKSQALIPFALLCPRKDFMYVLIPDRNINPPFQKEATSDTPVLWYSLYCFYGFLSYEKEPIIIDPTELILQTTMVKSNNFDAFCFIVI